MTKRRIIQTELRPALQQIRGWKNLVLAEIGVSAGVNARVMVEKLDLARLYLIDPYRIRPEYKEEALEHVLGASRDSQSHVVWLYLTSEEAAAHIEDLSLDAVYIDGDHSLAVVECDIATYYQKVRPGGLVSGHDFKSREQGVVRSVLAFATARKLQFHVEEWDWWFFKPEEEE